MLRNLQIAAMPLRLIALLASLWAASPANAVEQGSAASSSANRQLSGLDAAQANALIGRLQDAQRRLSAGEQLFFELLAGAPASYPMTEMPPRRAFLDMAFERAVIIERVPTSNRLWQPYRLVIASNGPGQLIWDIEVVLGFGDDIERVTMIYRPPPPATPPPPPRQ